MWKLGIGYMQSNWIKIDEQLFKSKWSHPQRENNDAMLLVDISCDVLRGPVRVQAYA